MSDKVTKQLLCLGTTITEALTNSTNQIIDQLKELGGSAPEPIDYTDLFNQIIDGLGDLEANTANLETILNNIKDDTTAITTNTSNTVTELQNILTEIQEINENTDEVESILTDILEQLSQPVAEVTERVPMPDICATVDGQAQYVTPVMVFNTTTAEQVDTIYRDSMGQPITGAVAATDDCDCECLNCDDATATDDAVPSSIVGEPSTVDVSENDMECREGATTYQLVADSEVNSTVTPDVSATGSFDATPTATGNWSFDYEILCDGEATGVTATVSGEAIICGKTGAWTEISTGVWESDMGGGVKTRVTMADFAQYWDTNGPAQSGAFDNTCANLTSSHTITGEDSLKILVGRQPSAPAVPKTQFKVEYLDADGNSVELTDPLVHFGGIGGFIGGERNTSEWTITSGSVSMLSGANDFEVVDGATVRQGNIGIPESNAQTCGTGEASGTIKVDGTVSEYTFDVVMLDNNGNVDFVNSLDGIDFTFEHNCL